MLITDKGAKSTDLLNQLSTKIADFAILSRLVVRKSASFKPEVFLMALLKEAHFGKASFNKIAIEMRELDCSCEISSQALWKRLTRADCMLETFVSKCIALVVSHGVVEARAHRGKFGRILTEDSSFVKMTKLCADLFPAHGNKHGKTAGLKLNLIFDLLSGESVELSTHAGTCQDKNIAWDVLDVVRKHDLVLRDMGYFNVSIFQGIEARGAYWLSRIPANVNISCPKGQTLESILEKSKSAIVERRMQMTEELHDFRLIAIRKPKEEGDEAVRKLKKAARQKGTTASKKPLIRAGWHLLPTSVSKEKMTARELGRLYAQRWQIEIIFKAWKQAHQLEQSLSRRSNYQHLLGIFMSEVLILSVSMHHYARMRFRGGGKAKRTSIMKIFDWLNSTLKYATHLTDILRKKPSERHVKTQSRKRKFQLISMLELLG